MSRKYLEVDEEDRISASPHVQAELSLIPKRTNLICIFGPPRSGKSFLLDCLCDDPHSFLFMEGLVQPCTQGADISNTVRSLVEFSGDENFVVNEAIDVRFVDTEGTGDRNREYDMKLFCPMLLISSVIVFNWSGGLQISGITFKTWFAFQH